MLLLDVFMVGIALSLVFRSILIVILTSPFLLLFAYLGMGHEVALWLLLQFGFLFGATIQAVCVADAR